MPKKHFIRATSVMLARPPIHEKTILKWRLWGRFFFAAVTLLTMRGDAHLRLDLSYSPFIGRSTLRVFPISEAALFSVNVMT